MRSTKKLNVSGFKKKWRYPLHAAIHGKNIEIFFALISDPAFMSMINELEEDSKRTPIYRAIIGGQVGMLVALLKKGAHLNQIQGIREDTSPLLVGIRHFKRNLIKLLLFFNADMELTCPTGESPTTLLAKQSEVLQTFVAHVMLHIEEIKTTLSAARTRYIQENFIEAAEHYYQAANQLIELGEYGLERSSGDQLYPLVMREFDPEAETYGERTLSFYQGEGKNTYKAALEASQRAERQGNNVDPLRNEILNRMRILDIPEASATKLIGASMNNWLAPGHTPLLWETAAGSECETSSLMSALSDPEECLRALMSQREKTSDKTQIAPLDRKIMLLAQHLENTHASQP